MDIFYTCLVTIFLTIGAFGFLVLFVAAIKYRRQRWENDEDEEDDIDITWP